MAPRHLPPLVLRVAPDGTPVEWVLTPAVEILAVGPDGLLARSIDELGVHRVARYAYR